MKPFTLFLRLSGDMETCFTLTNRLLHTASCIWYGSSGAYMRIKAELRVLTLLGGCCIRMAAAPSTFTVMTVCALGGEARAKKLVQSRKTFLRSWTAIQACMYFMQCMCQCCSNSHTHTKGA